MLIFTVQEVIIMTRACDNCLIFFINLSLHLSWKSFSLKRGKKREKEKEDRCFREHSVQRPVISLSHLYTLRKLTTSLSLRRWQPLTLVAKHRYVLRKLNNSVQPWFLTVYRDYNFVRPISTRKKEKERLQRNAPRQLVNLRTRPIAPFIEALCRGDLFAVGNELLR